MAGEIHVLLVEDEFLIRLTLAEALEADGFLVTEAASADEATAHLERTRFALLLTDITLPGTMTGLQLAEAALARDPELRVIYVTGRPDSAASHASSPREIFIAKPYLPSQVCAAARRLIGLPPT